MSLRLVWAAALGALLASPVAKRRRPSATVGLFRRVRGQLHRHGGEAVRGDRRQRCNSSAETPPPRCSGQLRTQKTDPQLDVVIMDTTTAALACTEGLGGAADAGDASGAGLRSTRRRARQGVRMRPGRDVRSSRRWSTTRKAVTPAANVDHGDVGSEMEGPGGSRRAAEHSGSGAHRNPGPQGDTGDWTKADPAFEQLRALAPSVQTFQTQPDPYTLILNGTLTYATGWNARGQQLYHDRSQGTSGRDVAERRDDLPDQHDQSGEGRAASGRRRWRSSATPCPPRRRRRSPSGCSTRPPTPRRRSRPRPRPAPRRRRRTRRSVIPIDWTEMLKLRDGWNQRWRREVITAGAR